MVNFEEECACDENGEKRSLLRRKEERWEKKSRMRVER
jgi:hypothetical protein